MIRSTGPFGSVSYAYNAGGQTISRQVAGQSAVAYAYDAANNLISASTTGASVAMTYGVNDELLGASRSNGVNGQYGFDNNGRLISISEKAGGGSATILSRSMTYDALNQIATRSVEAGQALPLQTSASAFSSLNQVTSGSGSTFTYDANGDRMTEVSVAGTTSYTWDARGRLQAISAPGGVLTSFLYDYDGNLIQKRVTQTGSDVVEQYVLDDLTNVAQQEQVGTGTVNFLNGRAPDTQFATISGGSPAFAIADYNGSIAALTDGTGAITSRFYYSPEGQTTASGPSFPVEFTNRQQVAQDLYYFRARYLDARSGNFLSEDPSGIDSGDTNLYRYGYGDPVDYVDPSGTIGTPLTIALAGPVGFGASLLGTAITNHELGKPLLDSSQYNPFYDAAIAGGTGIVTAAIGAKYKVAGLGGLAALGAAGNIAQTVLQNAHHSYVDTKGKSLTCNLASGVPMAVATGAIGGMIGGPVVANSAGAAGSVVASGLKAVALGLAKGFASVAKVGRGPAGNVFSDVDYTTMHPLTIFEANPANSDPIRSKRNGGN